MHICEDLLTEQLHLADTICANANRSPAPKMTAARSVARAAQRGMTLVEILVVLAIIGLIMGGVAVVAGGAFSGAQTDTARNEVNRIAGLADMYTVKKKGKCPKDMKALKAAGIIKKVAKDPWGNEFKIVCEDGALKGVVSAGKDGEFDSEDDINSWDEAKPKDEDADNE